MKETYYVFCRVYGDLVQLSVAFGSYEEAVKFSEAMKDFREGLTIFKDVTQTKDPDSKEQ
jgi:hypothetical protein